MTKLAWDATGERLFETGVSKGVLFPVDADGAYGNGVAWNGLTAVTESPSGAEASPLYADNVKYLSLTSAEEFGATIEAYMYPDEFAACDGTGELLIEEVKSGVTIGQQARKMFGFCYTTQLGNDVAGDSFGKKIHIIYGAKAAPSERGYATINDSPEAITFSWEVTTTPVEVTGFKPTASLTIDSTKISLEALAALEAKLYGVNADAAATPPVSAAPAELPLPDEILEIIAAADAG